MTDADNVVNTAAALAPVQVQEQPEAQEIPEPRITNAAEGKKKQRDAAKRLSDYSKEVASRNVDQPVAEDEPDVSPQDAPPPFSAPPPRESENSSNDFSESSIGVGNIIALAGVGIAALCLYLSYKSDKGSPEEDEPKISSNVQEEAPQSAPKAAKTDRAPLRNAAKPKFRRL